MSNLILNPNTYFTKNIYVTTIQLSNNTTINITNMSIAGDISATTINTSALSTNTINTKNSTLINFNPIYNNSTKILNSIGYTGLSSTDSSYKVLYSSLTTKQTQMTITGLPAGVYIFHYLYQIYTATSTITGGIYNIYDYLDNTTTNTTILKKGRTLNVDFLNQDGNIHETTFGVLTSASNTVTFSLHCTHFGTATGFNLNFWLFNIRYTRLA